VSLAYLPWNWCVKLAVNFCCVVVVKSLKYIIGKVLIGIHIV